MVKKSTELVPYEQQLLAMAEVAAATEDSVALGQFFGLKGGILTFNNAPMAGNKMQVVVIDHLLSNVLDTCDARIAEVTAMLNRRWGSCPWRVNARMTP